MDTAVRAHRILGAMANCQKANSPGDTLPKLADVRLGDLIGCYQNPGPEGETIGIFADGLAWNEGGRLIELSFADVQEGSLPSEKASEGVLLTMRDGKQFRLPVRGQRGRFFDSMEMLRFLDRVIQDLRGQAHC
ncbi:hypothetical protein GCM10023165_16420 [Variovorax defluvii]|uniref:Uncharacterized protein n=1 Tax=Variovorax defluvii TaxID=913761 RepID=A0ABP8HDZ9_9BURK